MSRTIPFEDRLLAKVRKEPGTDCWVWAGGSNEKGYGRIWYGARVIGAHRASYLHFVGPIPAGLEIDHTCRVRACVNPDHLEAVTHQVNLLRGNTVAAKHAAKTHCPRGHEYSKENTIMHSGSRECKKCVYARNRARYHAKKEKAAA